MFGVQRNNTTHTYRHQLHDFCLLQLFRKLNGEKQTKTISENGVLHFIEWSIKILQVFLAPFLLQHRHKLYENFFVDYRLLKDLEMEVEGILHLATVGMCKSNLHFNMLEKVIFHLIKLLRLKKTRLFSNTYLKCPSHFTFKNAKRLKLNNFMLQH